MQDTIVEPKNKREEWQFPRITQLFYPRQIKKTQDRMNWIEAMMLDRRLKDRPKLVLTRLALHFNLPTGRCDPSLRTLVRGVSMPGSEASAVRAVRKVLALAEKFGWIVRHLRFGGVAQRNQSNSYELTIPKFEPIPLVGSEYDGAFRVIQVSDGMEVWRPLQDPRGRPEVAR